MQLYLLLLTVFCILSWQTAEAQTSCDSKPITYQDVLKCAESRSLDIQGAHLDIVRAKAQIQAANQRPNPTLSAETFHRISGGENESETDITLGIPIELGGKRPARRAAAESGISAAEAQLFEARARVKLQVLLKLHRLRQAIHEQDIIDEAISTFSKLVTQYSRRPGLSPEQRVSLAVFQLSKSDYELKRSAMTEEILSLRTFFLQTTGFSIEEIRKALPQTPKNWPKVEVSTAPVSSPQLKLLEAELRTANAQFEVEKSEAWPNLTIGPSVKLLNEPGRSGQLYGLNLSLPLPVFNTNSGGKAVAAANVNVVEAKKRYGIQAQELKRNELTDAYNQSVNTLATSLSHTEIEKRHAAAESLFTKGVVPSSLVIEAHRTSLELEKTRHESELRALEALFGLHTIDGTILEVNL